MFSLLLLLGVKLFQIELESEWYPYWADEDIEEFVFF
jgi:hypothetical protein